MFTPKRLEKRGSYEAMLDLLRLVQCEIWYTCFPSFCWCRLLFLSCKICDMCPLCVAQFIVEPTTVHVLVAGQQCLHSKEHLLATWCKYTDTCTLQYETYFSEFAQFSVGGWQVRALWLATAEFHCIILERGNTKGRWSRRGSKVSLCKSWLCVIFFLCKGICV